MTAIYIILGILVIAVFLWLGYFLWSISLDKYDYNIFNLGVIIRGLLAIGSLWLGIIMVDSNDGSTTVFFVFSAFLFIWTFIATALRTNIIIAFLSFIYQLFAVFFVKSLINKVLKWV